MRKLWVIFLVFSILACRDTEEVNAPENLIPENKMVEVLTDLSLLNSAKNYNRRQLESTGLRPIEYLYERHGIDSVTLAQSTRYYANYPADLERIYTRVKDNLESLKEDLELIREEENKEKDSLLQENDTLQEIQQDRDSVYVNPRIFRRERTDSLPPAMEVDFDEQSL